MLGLGSKKSSGKKKAGQTGAKPADRADLIVHNMPPADRLSSGLALSPSRIKPGQSVVRPKSFVSGAAKPNFKMVGVLIIAGGVVFIGLLFYLSYIFIIKPAANSKLSPASVVNAPTSSISTTTDVSNSATEIAPIILDNATTTALATTTAMILDLATSTTSTTIDNNQTTTEAAPLIDSDNDGLNDEEEAVFGTNPNLADTNNNTYNDLTEILNNYNPIGSGKLSVDPALTVFVSKILGYSVLAPKNWPVKSLNNDNTVLFNAPDDSLIQISLQDNTSKQSILSWYNDAFPDDSVTYDRLKSTATWDGVMAADGFNFYLTDKKRKSVFIISYIPAVDSRVAYPTVFKMIIDSLTLK